MMTKAFGVALSGLLTTAAVWAGVDKQIQNQYVDRYKNQALYLKIPVHGFRQAVRVSAEPALDYSTASQPLAFKVGDQVRVTDVDFKGDHVRFKLASIDLNREAELIFQFPGDLDDAFPQRPNFDKALDYALTFGLSYKDIDSAKEDFIKDQFDQLIDRFASTTGTTSEFVIQTISEKNPEFQRLRKALADQRNRSERLQEQVQAAEAKARSAESSVAKLRGELKKAEADADSLNEDRSSLLSEKEDLAEQVEKLREENRRWQAKNGEYERQVNQLIQNLEVKTGAEAELGTRVQSLGDMINTLRTERGDLSTKLTETGRLVQQLQTNNSDLTEKLATAERERSRLASNLKELTSDKNSLQSRYLKSKTEREALETARRLEAAFRLEPFRPSDEDFLSAELLLASQTVGTLRVRPPAGPDTEAVAVFEAASPDTVKFSEEQRKLYAALGSKLRLHASWELESEAVSVSLTAGEAEQAVGPRETGEWRWNFQGSAGETTPALLKISLTDADDLPVRVAERRFDVPPGGWRSWLAGGTSFWALGLAFLTGSLLAGALGVAVGRSRDGRSKPASRAANLESNPKRL